MERRENGESHLEINSITQSALNAFSERLAAAQNVERHFYRASPENVKG